MNRYRCDKVLKARWFAHAAFLALFLSLVACSGPAEGVWLNAPGWRRAQLVGESSIPDPVTIALDDDLGFYTILAVETDGRQTLRVLHLDRSLNEVWHRDLGVAVNRPDRPQIVWDGQQLRLYWIDGNALYGASMDRSGDVNGASELLSGDAVVSSYDIAVNGEQLTVWFGGSAQEPGVFALDVGAPDAEPMLIDGDGYGPQVRFDASGDLHAVWLRYPPGMVEAAVYYAHYANGSLHTGSQTDAERDPLITFTVGFTSGVEGPYFGIDDEHAYVLWSILVRTGPAAGSATTTYIAFPLGQPQEAPPRQALYVPDNFDLTYQAAPADSFLDAGPRVPLSSVGGGAVPLALWPNERAASELVVAVRATIAYQYRKQASQSALIYFEDGAAREYQLLSFSRTSTAAPYVQSDAAGHLYATWIEPGAESRYVAYLAGTAPDVYAAVNEISVEDVGRIVSETIFGMLAGAALSPFAGILWLVAPFFVLAITSFLRRDDERTISRGSAVSLLLALAAYWLVKTETLPGFGDYVPFSAWIPLIPTWMGPPLRWGVSILIGGVALLTAWRFTYQRQAHSALNFMLIYAAVDSVLSMAVYGSIIYGFI